MRFSDRRGDSCQKPPLNSSRRNTVPRIPCYNQSAGQTAHCARGCSRRRAHSRILFALQLAHRQLRADSLFDTLNSPTTGQLSATPRGGSGRVPSPQPSGHATHPPYPTPLIRSRLKSDPLIRKQSRLNWSGFGPTEHLASPMSDLPCIALSDAGSHPSDFSAVSSFREVNPNAVKEFNRN